MDVSREAERRALPGGLLGHRSGADARLHLSCAEHEGLWDIRVKLSQSRWSHGSDVPRVVKA